MPFEIHETNGLVYLTASLLKGVTHGFSTRVGGVSPSPFDSLNLRTGCADTQENLLENFRRFCEATGADVHRTVLSKQVHETTVRICTSADAGKGLLFPRDYTADALVTCEKNLSLVVFSADCGIILLHDPVRQVIGAVHAGWRGCAGGILEQTVQTMQREFSCRPQDLRAAIGPCIGQCCFETDDDVPTAMHDALGTAAEAYLERRGAKWHVDLAGLNRQWLLRAGLCAKHIDLCDLCTACRPDLFWSHRKMGDLRGAQVAMISLEEGEAQ